MAAMVRFLAVLAAAALVPAQTAPVVRPTLGEVVRLDDRLNELIEGDAKIEVVASGFAFVVSATG